MEQGRAFSTLQTSLSLALLEGNQVSMSNLRQEIQAEGMPGIWGIPGAVTPRHMCLLHLGEPCFGAHIHSLSLRSARCAVSSAGGPQQHQVEPQSVRKCEIKHMATRTWIVGKAKHSLVRDAMWGTANDPGPFVMLQAPHTGGFLFGWGFLLFSVCFLVFFFRRPLSFTFLHFRRGCGNRVESQLDEIV